MNKNQKSYIQNLSKEIIGLTQDHSFTHYFIGDKARSVHTCYQENTNGQDKLMFKPVGRLGKYESAGSDSFSYYERRKCVFPRKLVEDIIIGDIELPSKLAEISIQNGEVTSQ